jgi:hypothetical protein
MAKLRLKYVNEYVDRTGRVRRYFRKGGKQLGTLPGDVGSAEFMAAYAPISLRSRQSQHVHCTRILRQVDRRFLWRRDV